MDSPDSHMEDPRECILSCLRQLCRLFWGPDIGQVQDMLEGRFFQPFRLMKPPPNTRFFKALQDIETFLGNFTDATTLFNTLEATYVRLFISDKGGISVPLYESCYASDGAPLMGPSAVAMQRRLDAVGLRMAGPGLHEPPDHLAIELEYLYFLLEKGWAGRNPAPINEARKFAAEALSPWIEPLAIRLVKAMDSAIYAPAACLAKELLPSITDACMP